mgnify:CR=1 FL=1
MMDGNWLMVVTAAILIIGGLLGYINGLIKTILNLVIGMITLVLVLVVLHHEQKALDGAQKLAV